ncbi:MAG TPA: F0F1 ATP synthase subunit B [Candidatus Nanopelagicales bacterium]|nr:F0F1 ATP synthase subunit B [Candidatus Nanopelagicales bacterium]
MDLYAAGSAIAAAAAAATAEAGGAGIQVNLFWIIVSAANFVLFLVILSLFAWKPITRTLDDRRAKIEQGLKDAEQARLDLERASATASQQIATARREARDILDRAQRVAQETRDTDITATRAELERMRVRAAAEIEAEKGRAISDLRAEVADLAISAAGRVVRESMDGQRQRRLVEEFLAESRTPGAPA